MQVFPKATQMEGTVNVGPFHSRNPIPTQLNVKGQEIEGHFRAEIPRFHTARLASRPKSRSCVKRDDARSSSKE
jgi:hypothetical protein